MGPTSAFWSSTPRLLWIAIKARSRAAVTAHNERAWLAWHTAFLPHMKRPPKFSDLTRKTDDAPVKRAQTADEVMAVMTRWRFATATMKPTT